MRKSALSWLMTSSYKEIAAGDQVFIWRARGTKRPHESYGIIAECIAEGPASERADDPNSMEFWTKDEGKAVVYRVWLKVIRLAERGLLLDQRQIASNPILASTGPLGYRAGTNYKLRPNESEELNRLWGKLVEETDTEKIGQRFAAQVSIFENLSLDRLMREYRRGLPKTSHQPARTQVSTFVFQRSALVKAIARVRAKFRCEMPECVTPSFPTISDEPYSEVHHLLRLADGGKDTIENVVCVCANHHRELHVGRRREELTKLLRTVRRWAC